MGCLLKSKKYHTEFGYKDSCHTEFSYKDYCQTQKDTRVVSYRGHDIICEYFYNHTRNQRWSVYTTDCLGTIELKSLQHITDKIDIIEVLCTPVKEHGITLDI